jgi:hypothetical protein
MLSSLFDVKEVHIVLRSVLDSEMIRKYKKHQEAKGHTEEHQYGK